MSAAETPAPPGPPGALPAPRRKRAWLTVLLCLAIFVAGGVVGAGITVIHVYRTVLSALQHPERTPERIARRMQKRLDLTDEQTGRIEEILRRRQKPMLEARRELLERNAPELDALEDEVAAELTPGQALHWREHFRQMRRDLSSGAGLDLPDNADH